MMLMTALVISVVCSVALFALMKLLRKGIAASATSGKDQLLADIDSNTKALQELTLYKDSYASKGQFQFVEALHSKALGDLEKEKATLKEIENKLDTAQKAVGEKETAQQDLKSAKAEDENKLQDLLTKHADLSNEAIGLEQKLAQSLKNLDALLNELQLTQDQRAMLQEMQNAVTSASARLRDLIAEYSGVNERLEALKQQHLDLEDEYTKLVEQQLGD
ncbi:MAG: hypothetical protein K1X79_12045 [Oligoflexia bacterium]|nr:hypothetical protein [Oligoflexia bacterium]